MREYNKKEAALYSKMFKFPTGGSCWVKSVRARAKVQAWHDLLVVKNQATASTERFW
jgi:hypothetical protein